MVAGIGTIDVSKASADFWAANHSAYAEKSDLLVEIEEIIKSDTHEPPDARSSTHFKRWTRQGVPYWEYVQP